MKPEARKLLSFTDNRQDESTATRSRSPTEPRGRARATALRSQANDPWEWMFEEGARRRPRGQSDIVPLWIYTDGDARIERIVPTLPLSRDRSRLEALKRSLVAYRLAFGQPRQEELVAYLQEHFSGEEIERLKVELHINLAPKTRR